MITWPHGHIAISLMPSPSPKKYGRGCGKSKLSDRYKSFFILFEGVVAHQIRVRVFSITHELILLFSFPYRTEFGY